MGHTGQDVGEVAYLFNGLPLSGKGKKLAGWLAVELGEKGEKKKVNFKFSTTYTEIGAPKEKTSEGGKTDIIGRCGGTDTE